MLDRIERAHALRAAIHAWVKVHPRSGMAAIQAAFAETSPVTVRKAVQRLSDMGYMRAEGRSTATVYLSIGDAIYQADAQRIRLRIAAGASNLVHGVGQLNAYQRAWATRRDIHAFVRANPQCAMVHIEARFAGIPSNTLRKHVGFLCRIGNLHQSGKGSATRYSALTEAIYDVGIMREKLRQNGRTAGHTPRMAHIEMREQAVETVPGEPWRLINRPEKHRPLREQQGQGSYRGQLNGHSSLGVLA